MTKREYHLIAESLRSHFPVERTSEYQQGYQEAIMVLVQAFVWKNPRFDIMKFLHAVYEEGLDVKV